MKRRSWHCKACHKKAFGSESIALNVIDQIHDRGAVRRGGPSRTYECPYNPGTYHLTSQEQRTA